MVRVCIIGLGTVGDPTAEYIASFHSVFGYDINASKIKNQIFFSTTNWEDIANIDVFIICVNTWWNEKPDMSAIKTVMQKIKEKSSQNTLVIIESTISLGTSRKLFEEIFNSQILLAHCPHRYWGKDSKNYGVAQTRVLGAIDDESLNQSRIFYESIHIPIHIVPNIEIAEMSKLMENSYRFVQIAFVEELKNICEDNNLDFEELRIACNTKWNIDLLEARNGITGECLSKDIRTLNFSASFAPLLQGAIKADVRYKHRLTEGP